MWKRVVGYAALLAAGTLALQWLDYQRLVRMHSGDVYLFLVAAAFLVLGIVLGVRVFAAPAPAAFDGQPESAGGAGPERAGAGGAAGDRGRVHLSTPVLTPLHRRSRLVCKERRNSPHSGTHLRQTGGFFVPTCLVGATDAKPASGGRLIQHPQGE